MTLTILLDLDDTLIDTNMQNFIPAYFKALSDTLQTQVSPEIMLPALMGGTRKMMGKNDPEKTLKEIFDDYFYSIIGINRAEIKQGIDLFYDDVFPKLKYLTQQRPHAIEFVKKAFEKKYSIVIATNPLFPLKAIQHRLRWAGLAPEDYPYTLITSYETSHFTKENNSYFPEILGKLGWMEDPVIMVGNDFKMDMEPAIKSGLPVYWITDGTNETNDHTEIPQGSIKDLHSWFEKVSINSLQHTIDKPSSLMALLRATPAVLEENPALLSEAKIDFHSTPQEWSIKEVICHLRDVEIEVNIPRIKKILNQENPFIVGEDTDQWAIERNYADQDGNAALESFIKARKVTLDLLENLITEWDRSARHSIFGSYTLQELVGVMAGHDKNHIRQIHKNQIHQQ
jgi:FMN phosphatase YigB (HAD superfamily)